MVKFGKRFGFLDELWYYAIEKLCSIVVKSLNVKYCINGTYKGMKNERN